MRELTLSQSTETRNEFGTVFAILANRSRRRLLGTLYEHAPKSVRPQALVETLAETTDTDRQQSEIALHHSHLPKLEQAGLIMREDAGVTLADHPAYEDRRIVNALTATSEATATSYDEIFKCLGNPRRRIVLDALSHRLQPIHIEMLAREVGARESDMAEQDVPEQDLNEILVSLHHVHLPKLRDAELISFERDDETVVYDGRPKLRIPWIHSAFASSFRSSLTADLLRQKIGTIEGRR